MTARTVTFRATKRALDVVLGGALLLACAPLLGAVAAAVRVRMGTPVLFRQSRIGKREASFVLLKFRTMRPGPATDAKRITPLGRWLRRTSLDELPSLLNVLRGDMSLVGPRPLLARYVPHYTDEERLRHRVRPGLTGWAQVHGRNRLDWDARLAHDPVADTAGQASIQVLFQMNGDASGGYTGPVSDGWGGDTLVPYQNGNQYGYVWELAWDSRVDAREFEDAYRDALTSHDARAEGDGVYVVPESDTFGDAFRVTRDGNRVRIVNAPTVDALDDIHAG